MAKTDNIYFVGIGGIGMSAIARHYKKMGKNVSGYDKTNSRLIEEMASEGIKTTFQDCASEIPQAFKDKANTTVVYTPAIPKDNEILTYFRENGFDVVKRAVMLGDLTKNHDAICISGSHGKTTTSTLVAHIMRNSTLGCSAFLGGISSNYDTNYWSNTDSDYVVTEADEYDRSFLQLHPFLTLITAMDPDHLDIYGTKDEMRKAFHQFASQTTCGGSIIYKYGLEFNEGVVDEDVEIFTYSLSDSKADFYAYSVVLNNEGLYTFSVSTPMGQIRDLTMGLPGLHNVENAVAAIALANLAGVEDSEIRKALASFRGNRRRFDFRIRTKELTLIDDYAHHPEEIRTMLTSVKAMYPHRKVTVAFQPHLYTRTRDFANEFASALSLADRVVLLNIYPARELPIEGVNSEMLASKITTDVTLTTKEHLVMEITSKPIDVVVVMGAGDIDRLVEPIEKQMLEMLKK
ncbi:MAG: UDP-N-acetylmuramate--L-alanine ligase [Bacteroidales bacterium]|nr:UDP-N-acetylmuramate--L-alanine ligase [Bacteroidales bacterium]